jgi:uncharacterized protein (TIGR03435 family)
MNAPDIFTAARRSLYLLIAASIVSSCSEAPPKNAAEEFGSPSAQTEETRDSAPHAYPVMMTPSTSPYERLDRNPDTGETRLTATPIANLVRFAYDTHPADVIYAVPLDYVTRYDVILRPADGQTETARSLLRERLENEFDIQAFREPRTVPVLILKRTEDAAELPENTASGRMFTGGGGHLKARKASTKALARFIRTLSAEPIIDESGLEGEYDFELEWDPTQGNSAFATALRTIGFKLVPGERPVERLILRRTSGG